MMTDCKLKEAVVLLNRDASTVLRAQSNSLKTVILHSGNLMTNISKTVSGICARVYDGGVYGFASDSDYSTESVMKVLSAANANSVFMAARAGMGKSFLPPIDKYQFDNFSEYTPTDQRVLNDICRAADAYIARKYPSLSSRTVYATEGTTERLLLCSDYAEAFASTHSFLSRSRFLITLGTVTNAGEQVSLFDSISAEGLYESRFSRYDDIYTMIDRTYEQLMQKRCGIHPDAGLKTCILGGSLAGVLAHEAVGHTVESDMVLSGSVASKHLNQQVASPIVNLVDFAHTALGKPAPLPLYVDDEGVETKDAVIIKDGILVGYMNNRESAQYFGVEPAGNARAYDFSDEPLIRMRNTAILPGKDSLDEMIASVDDGYYLIREGNGQADTTGEFMFAIEMGYEIKHGKLGRAILDTTISGVAFEMLKTVDMLSDDMEWSCASYCSKKQAMPVAMGGPAMRCKMLIGGR